MDIKVYMCDQMVIQTAVEILDILKHIFLL